MKKKTKENLKFHSPFNERFYALSLIVSAVSLLGFIVENIWLALRYGVVNNRNMNLPLLFGYGLAMLAVYLLFGTPREPRFILKKLGIDKLYIKRIAYYLLVFFCVCVGEAALGYTVETAVGISWWSYESLPLNIGQYTSVPTSAVFSLLILIFMDHIFTPLYNFFISLNPKLLKWLSLSLISLMTADFINSGLYMLTKKKLLKKWQFTLFKKGLLSFIIPK